MDLQGAPIFALFGAVCDFFTQMPSSQNRHSDELPRPFRKKMVALSSRTNRSFQRHPDESLFSNFGLRIPTSR